MKTVLLRTICFVSLLAVLLSAISTNAKPATAGRFNGSVPKAVSDNTLRKAPGQLNPLQESGKKLAPRQTAGPLLYSHVVAPFAATGAAASHPIPGNAINITIRARGGAGGNWDVNKGGKGAKLSGSYGTSLQGKTIQIIVGQKGGSDGYNGGGGGGGSFAYYISGNSNVLLMAAGGGGGAALIDASPADDAEHDINANVLGPNGRYGTATSELQGGDFGTGGNGGQNARDVDGLTSDENPASGGGAGWNPSVDDNNFPELRGPFHGRSPQDATNPAAGGGDNVNGFGYGGFGGGGATFFGGGGGGGGYSGGGGGAGTSNFDAGAHGGGGGSYFNTNVGGTRDSEQPTDLGDYDQDGEIVIEYDIPEGCTPPAAVITANGATTFCTGGSVTLTSSSATGNLWSNGATTQSITVNASGIYTVKVTDGACSTVSDPVVVTVNTTPVPTITASGATTFCDGGSVTLTSSEADSYNWSTGATTRSIVVTESGTYGLEVTTNGCSANSLGTTVEVKQKPHVTASVSPNPVCYGTSGTITASSDMSGATFVWKKSGTTVGTGSSFTTTTLTAATTYSVQATADGCSSVEESIVVPVFQVQTPTVTAVGPTSFCSGGSVTLTASSASSYLWSNGATTQSITVNQTGSYSVTVFMNGCSATSAATQVTVKAIPSAPTVSVVNNCNNTSTLTASNYTGSLLWSTNESTPSISVSSAGTYTVTQTVNGCTSVAGSGVAAPKSTPATITYSTVTDCSGYVTVTATNATGSLLWTPNGETTGSIYVTASGTYGAKQTINGCQSASAPITVTTIAVPNTNYTVSGSMIICADAVNSTNVSIGLSGSEAGVTYRLVKNGNNTATTLAGTGSAIAFTGTFASFGAGYYNVRAEKAGLPCALTMSGNASLDVLNNPSTPTVTVVDNCGTATLTASNYTGSLSWSNGATTPSITVSTPGTYTVTQNVNGCTSITPGSGVAAPKAAPSAPAVTVTDNCDGTSILTASNYTGSLLWSNNATTPSITVSSAGTYTVTQTVNACTSAAGSGIAAPKTTPSAPTVTVVDNCNNTSTLTASNYTGSLLWSTNATTASITVNSEGTYSVTQTVNGCTSAAGSGIAAPKSTPVVNITAGGPTTFCAGGSVVLTSNSAANNSWSNGATTQSITVNASGSYAVTVNNNGCVATSSNIVVTVNPLPAAPAGTGNARCGAGDVTISATPGAGEVIDWYASASGGSPIATASNSYTAIGHGTTTTYYAEARNTTTGCTSATRTPVTATINYPATPTISSNAMPTTFCNGGSVTLTSSSAANNLWSNGATTQSIVVTASGDYTVSVTTTGCQATSAPVTVTVKPTPSTPIVSVADNCDGTSTLTASGYVGSLLWSNNATTSSITVSSAGTYTVTQTIDGCVSAAGSGVAAPKSTPATPVVTVVNNCDGTSVLTASGYTGSLLWSNNATTASITVNAAGTYTVAQTANGCTSALASGVASPKSTPATPVVTVTDYCNGPSFLTVSNYNPLATVLWSTGETTPGISVSSAGTYTVTQTVDGCTSAAGSGVAAPKTNPAPPTITYVANCNGTTVLTAQASGPVLWSTGETTNSITVTTSGMYTVTQVVNGCTSVPGGISVGTIKNTPATPVVTVVDNCNGTSTLVTTANGTLLWSTGETGNSITVSSAGTYTITQTIDGCVSAPGSGIANPKTTPAAPAVTVVNNCDGTSTLTASNYTGTLLWSNNATTPSITVSAPGSFTVTQTVNGCASMVNGGFASPKTAPAAPQVTVVDNCNGTSTLTASGYSGPLAWSTGETTATITVSAAGNYTVTQTVNGCTSAPFVAVANPKTAPSAPGVTVVDNCNNTSTLTASNYTGSLLWSNGQQTPSITVNAAGTYTVTQTVAGCTSAAGTGVAAPKATPAVINYSSYPNCDGSITVVANNATGSLVWTPNGETTNSIIVSVAGTYGARQTINGCQSNPAPITVTPVAVPVTYNVGGGAAVCSNVNQQVTITLSGSETGVTYVLYRNGVSTGMSKPGTSGALSFTGGFAPGTFTIKATKPGLPPACEYLMNGSASVTRIQAPVITITAQNNICAGVTLPVSASVTGGSGSYTYEWHNNSEFNEDVVATTAAFNATFTADTSFYVMVNDQSTGCSAIKPVFITVKPTPVATITAGGNTSVCPAQTVTLHANTGAGYTYQWFKDGNAINGATNADYIATVSGSYTVQITNNGCTSVSSNAIAVTVADTTAPVTPVLPNITAECAATATAPTTTDACAGTVVGTTTDALTYTTQGDHVIHWTFTDASGNTTTAEQHVIISDVTPPTVTCPANIIRTATNTGSGYGALVTYNATATDNCGTPTVTYSPASGSFFAVGTTTVTVTADDGNGHTSTCHFDVTVVAPEINITGNNQTIVDGDATPSTADHTNFGSTTLGVPVVKTFTIQNTGTENLDVSAINISGADAANFTVSGFEGIVLTPGASTTFDVTFLSNTVGTKTATVVVSNNDNDESVYDFAITADINCSSPVFAVCPSNKTVNTDAGLCSAVVNYSTTVNGVPAPSLTYSFSGATTGSGSGNGSGSVFNKGTTTVTITAHNACGDAVCSFTITVEDHENPVITNVPVNISKSNDAGACGAVVTWTIPTATDNCPVVTLVSDKHPGDVFPTGTTTVHYTATDASGNTASASFDVTVNDTEDPTITVPADVTHTADAGLCSYKFANSVADINTVTPDGHTPGYGPTAILLGAATGTDNCGTATVAGVRSDGLSLTDPYPVGVTTVTWTVTDAHGHTKTGVQTITITDDEFPVIHNLPANISKSTDANACMATVTWTAPTATDNCAVTMVSDHQSGEQFPIGTTTVTYTATDVHGHVTTGSFTVSVADHQLPTITCPGTITVPAQAGKNGANVVYVAQGADNCQAPAVTYSIAPGSLFPIGSTTVTATATDAAGNEATCSFNVIVTNNPPVANPDVNTTTEDTPVSGNVLPNDSDIDGHTLTVTTFTVNNISYTAGQTASFAEGTIVLNADGSYTYTPAANFNGAVPVVTYYITDGHGGTANATLTITVTPVNDGPVANPDTNTTSEDTPVSGNVLPNDSDIDGDVLTVTGFVINGTPYAPGNIALIPGIGDIVLNADGSYTYIPAPNYNGPVPVVTYSITDGHGGNASSTLTINVTPVDDAPVAVNDTESVNEDAVLTSTVRTNDTESGDGGNTWSIVTNPTHGTLVFNTDGTYTYTPNANFNGTDVFTYKVCDVDGDCSTATVTITVVSVDDAPVAVNDTESVNEDAVLTSTVRTNDTESGDGGNTWSIVTNPTHGTLVFNTDGTYTYTPNANFNGTDVFTYKVCDVDGDCSTATVTITVVSVDDAPVAVNDTESVNEDAVLTSTVRTNDTESGDGGNTWSVVTNPTHGTLVFNTDGTYTYTPNANFNGTDVFTYKVCDADGDCSTATVTITVVSVDDAPVAVNDTESVNEDAVLTSTVRTNDTESGDGGNTWSIVTNPTHGTLVFNTDGTYTYTPNANFNGTDVFTYKVCDVDGDCSTATVTITVVSVDDAPVAVNDTESVNEDAVLTSTVRTNDTESGDGGNTWSVVTNPTHGTLVFNTDGTYTYTPNANFNGTDVFTYKVCDADGDCSTATVTITVVPVNDVPVAVNDAVSTNEDVAIHSTVAGNDTPSPDGGNVWSVVSNPAHGTLVLNADGSYVYTPNANYHGTDAFTYKVCDINGDCATATVNITIASVNDPAVIKVRNITVYVDATGNVNITPGQIDNGSYDPDGIASITLNRTNFSCADIATSPNTVTLTVTDVDGNSMSANATVTVLDAIAPTIVCPAPVTVQCASAVPAPNTASVSAADNCSYTVSFVSDVISNQSAPNKYTITRTYKAVDPSGNQSTCTQIITVNDNTAPTLIVAGSLPGNSNGQCLAGVPAAPSTASIAALYTDNCSGTVTAVLTNTTTTGTNAAGWVRKYYYTITDASGNTTTACVTYSGKDTQAPVPNIATLPTVTAECNAFVTAPVATDNCAGTITGTTTSALSYTAQGTYVITWTYADGNGNTSTQTQTVIVKDVTPPAVTCPGDISVTANTTVSGQAGANVTYTALAVDNCTTPTITYSKASGSFFPVGTTTVTVTANDGNGNTSTCSFKVIVNCVVPVFTTCPTNKSVNTDAGNCSAVVTYTSAATATPTAACSYTFSGATTGSGPGNGSGKTFNRGVTTVTITASNLCGSATCSFTVTVVDNEKPRITAPAAWSVNNDAGKCGATIASLGTPVTSDNCGVASVTNDHPSTFYPVGKTIVKWTVTDVNGNVTDTAKTCVTVLDNEMPTISVTNVSVGNSAGICGANITLAAPVTADNCGVASVTNDHPSTYYPVGTTTVTWTVTDNAGWTKTATQTVTVTDTEKPAIVCAPNTTIACGLLPTPANTGSATATDNCGVASVTYTDVTNGNIITRTWKAVDAAGNTNTCTQTITVGGPFVASITSVPTSNTYTGGSANSLFIGYGAQSTVLQTNVPAGSYTYAWSGADAAMLSSTTTANPVFTPTRGGSFTFTVTVKNALGCTNTATITICVTDIRVFATATPPSNNNCGHQSHYSWNCPHGGHGHSCSHGSHNSYNCPDKEDQDDKQGMCNHQSHNSYDCPHKGHNHTCNHRSHTSYNCSHRSCNDRDDDDDHQRTCNHQSHTSSDCSHRGHNHASCNHQGHSSYNCPHSGNSNDQKVCNHQSHSSGDCNHNGHNHGNCNHRSHSSSDCPHNGGNGGTDDDDEKKVYICHVPPGNPAQRMTLSIGISAVAAHLENHPGDRLGSCDQAPCSGYTDNVKPVIDCSDNVTIAYGSSTSPAVTGSPEADDNSGDVTITYTDASTKGSDATAANYYNYVITRTWKATDLAGNYATCVQTITVTETTKPMITCPGSTTVACGSTAPSVAGTATATDNSGVVNITYTDAVSGNKTTRTWKATDPSGNYATCTQTITVVDNVAPVLTEPNDITVNCGTSTLPAATGTATATDNCSNVTITYTDVAGTNKITRTWKATDASGNYSTDVQVITIVDLVKPTITAPADISISCSASTTPSYCGGNATASDNCSSVSISYSDSKTGNVITRTWKATDASGNFATDTQTITITDNTKPVISVPGAISLSCGSSTTPSGCNSMATATDNCSTPVVTYSDAVNGNKITRTWTATDAAGNFSTGTQIITIVDNTKPTFTVPSAVTVNCGSSTLPAATGTATATDACSTPVVTYTDATSGNVITRTWKAVDAAGNTTTAAQYITVGVPFTANITSVPTNSTYTGGVSTNLYLGYGAQSTTLTMCSLPSSGAPYTYAWSGSFVNKLSSTTAASPLFTPGVSGYFTFNVTVTNKYGCTSFATISICVTDIRVPGTNGSKVYMCHTVKYKAPQTIQVALSQVSSHLSSSTCGSDGNDRLGSCDQAPCNSVNEVSAPIVVNKTTATGESAEAVATTEEELKVTVMPNPSTTYFTLKMESKYETPISMRVMDANGRVVDAKTKIGANSTIQIGHNYASGTYYAELVQGAKRKVIQLIKARG